LNPALNLKSQISNLKSSSCDLCGATGPELILTTPRLDGPLVRCRGCNLYYVIVSDTQPSSNQGESRQAAEEMIRLAERAQELALVETQVEEREKPWRELMATERLNDLKRFVTSGRLLEIGCSTGEMIAASRLSFQASGVEADRQTSLIARSRGLNCFNGTLSDARFPDNHFDVVALYHVIEHYHSPRAELVEMRRILKPGGWLVIETPNIATLWYQLLNDRWRQFIPDHLFFFTPKTISRLCEGNGFTVRELNKVGKAMSVRLFISRLGRYHKPTARILMSVSNRLHLTDYTLHLNLGDVMRLYARKRDEG
jgi:SAM-dependent methyltransferase